MRDLAPDLERDVVHEYPSGLGLEEFPFVLVLDAATMSAHQYVSSQRIAGYNVRAVVQLFRQICQRTKDLHGPDLQGLAHCDLKLRNVLLRFVQGNIDVILCDLDAAHWPPIGEPQSNTNKLGSSAYFSPELARWSLADSDQRAQLNLRATPAMDVWACGVILFELCTGRFLFSQDISDNESMRLLMYAQQ